MRKKLLKLSLIAIIVAVVVFAINYVVFHFVTDDGFTTEFQQEAQKPFVADLIGQLGVLFVFLSASSLMVALIFFSKATKDGTNQEVSNG